jgi:uncharacterized protein (TIGR03382 family)
VGEVADRADSRSVATRRGWFVDAPRIFASNSRGTRIALEAVIMRSLLLSLALLLALGACGDSNEPLGQTQSALFSNDKAAFQYFVGKGLTNFQAAGIVGNLDQESGVDPNAVQQNGPGRGIAQWSVGGRWDTDSNDNAAWFAKNKGQSIWSLQLQLDFIWYELTTFSGYGLASLKNTANVTDATVVFQTDFEGCGQCLQSQRIAYAKAVLAAYGTIDYAAQFVGQSFPLATMTLTMEEGQVIPSYIELKNTGAKAWDSNTRIGTTQPRDRKSAFADGTWLSPSRPAAVQGTVAPGATYKFKFDLAAPMKPGTYDEFFGVVEEGVAWFSDPSQGGPPDNDLEVKIVVVPASDSGVKPDGGMMMPSSDAGESDGGPGIGDGEEMGPQPGGCNAAGAPSSSSWVILAALALLRPRRRR